MKENNVSSSCSTSVCPGPALLLLVLFFSILKNKVNIHACARARVRVCVRKVKHCVLAALIVFVGGFFSVFKNKVNLHANN